MREWKRRTGTPQRRAADVARDSSRPLLTAELSLDGFVAVYADLSDRMEAGPAEK